MKFGLVGVIVGVKDLASVIIQLAKDLDSVGIGLVGLGLVLEKLGHAVCPPAR